MRDDPPPDSAAAPSAAPAAELGTATSTEDASAGPPGRRAAFAFIFVTLAIEMLAVGMFIPVLPRLVADFLGGEPANAAMVYGLFGTTWALMQLVFAPVQGALSDRFGRRPVILVSSVGLGVDYVLMALAPNLIWLFVGRIISGICAATISTAFAYVADVTPADKRAGRFGMLSAAFGIGFVLGPAIGGLAGSVDPRLPFWIAAGLSLANALYGLFVLPESLPPEKRSPFLLKRANPLGALALLRSQPRLESLALIYFIGQLAHVVLPSVAVLYLTFRYGWDERAIGFAFAASGFCSIIVQGGLVRLAVARLGERPTLFMGLAFGVAGFVTAAFAAQGWMFWLAIPLLGLWGLAGPAVQSLMSRGISPLEQGRLQGANASLQGLASLIGPTLFTQTYAIAIAGERGHDWAGAPFLVAAALLATAALAAQRATRGEISQQGPG